MRPSQVVVVDELGQDVLDVLPAEDLQVVEALAPDRANPALGERVWREPSTTDGPAGRDDSRSLTRSTR